MDCKNANIENTFSTTLFNFIDFGNNRFINSEEINLTLLKGGVLPEYFFEYFLNVVDEYKKLYLNLGEKINIDYNQIPFEFINETKRIYHEIYNLDALDKWKIFRLFSIIVIGKGNLKDPKEAYFDGLYDELQLFRIHMKDLSDLICKYPDVKKLIDDIEIDRLNLKNLIDEFYDKLEEIIVYLVFEYDISPINSIK